MSTEPMAVSVRITGRVQGVGYRWSTQLQAAECGVRGWVQNDCDGAVSGHFEGDRDAVDRLVLWCQSGPRMAKVHSVETAAAEVVGFTRFEVRN